jgi:hypothetical protein
MALALRFQGLLQQGLIADYATLARLGHVSRARITQIMNLAVLAPDIQETLLFLPRTERGRDPLHVRHLQPLTRIADWANSASAGKRCSATGNQRRPDEASQSGLRERGCFPGPFGGRSDIKTAGPLSWPDIVRSEKSNPRVNRGTC